MKLATKKLATNKLATKKLNKLNEEIRTLKNIAWKIEHKEKKKQEYNAPDDFASPEFKEILIRLSFLKDLREFDTDSDAYTFINAWYINYQTLFQIMAKFKSISILMENKETNSELEDDKKFLLWSLKLIEKTLLKHTQYLKLFNNFKN